MAYVNERVRIDAAIIVGESTAMDVAANKVLAAVRAVASTHVDTGAYMRNLRIVSAPGQSGSGRQVRDRLIVADDPGSIAIEDGYITRIKGSRRVKWTPGLHIMRRGLDAS